MVLVTLDQRREEAFRIISLELPWMTFDKKTALVKALEICFVLGASESLVISRALGSSTEPYADLMYALQDEG